MFIILFGNQTLSLFLFTASIRVAAKAQVYLVPLSGSQLQNQVSFDTGQSVVPAMMGKPKYREKEE